MRGEPSQCDASGQRNNDRNNHRSKYQHSGRTGQLYDYGFSDECIDDEPGNDCKRSYGIGDDRRLHDQCDDIGGTEQRGGRKYGAGHGHGQSAERLQRRGHAGLQFDFAGDHRSAVLHIYLPVGTIWTACAGGVDQHYADNHDVGTDSDDIGDATQIYLCALASGAGNFPVRRRLVAKQARPESAGAAGSNCDCWYVFADSCLRKQYADEQLVGSHNSVEYVHVLADRS